MQHDRETADLVARIASKLMHQKMNELELGQALPEAFAGAAGRAFDPSDPHDAAVGNAVLRLLIPDL